MPLEIRELIIRASVNNSDNMPTGQNNNGGGSNALLLNEVAEKVFEIIKEKAER